MIEQNTHATRLKLGEENAPPLSESELAAIAKRILWEHENKFFGQNGQDDWRGGIGRQFGFDDVVSVLSVIESRKVTAQKLTPNTNLAITQALRHAEVEEISDSQIAELRNEARRETRRMYRLQNGRLQGPQAGKIELKKSKRKWGWKVAAAPIIPVLVLAAYAGSELISSNSENIDINESQSQAPEVVEDFQEVEEESKKSLGFSTFIRELGEIIKPIPLIEELKEEDDDPYTFRGFNVALPEVKEGEEIDPSKFIHFEWESEKVVESNGGALKAILYPVKDDGGRSFGWKCLRIPDKDCSKVVDNFIIIGGHSGVVENNEGELVELAMEPLRAFIEGHKLEGEGPTTMYEGETQGEYRAKVQVAVGGYSETLSKVEREQKMDLLEEERLTITLGGHQAKAQVAVVRIEEVDRDKLYADWSRAVEIALKYDHSLGEQINLEGGGLILAISGRRLPGDRLSGNNHHEYTSSVILVFIAEAAPAN